MLRTYRHSSLRRLSRERFQNCKRQGIRMKGHSRKSRESEIDDFWSVFIMCKKRSTGRVWCWPYSFWQDIPSTDGWYSRGSNWWAGLHRVRKWNSWKFLIVSIISYVHMYQTESIRVLQKIIKWFSFSGILYNVIPPLKRFSDLKRVSERNSLEFAIISELVAEWWWENHGSSCTSLRTPILSPCTFFCIGRNWCGSRWDDQLFDPDMFCQIQSTFSPLRIVCVKPNSKWLSFPILTGTPPSV